jgi:hypothetical protein
VHQRHDDLGGHAGDELHVAWIREDVVHEQRLFARNRGPDEPFPEPQPPRRFAIGVADRVGDFQFATTFVEQVDGKRFERDQPRDQPRNLLQELVELENRRDLSSQVEKRCNDLMFGAGGR